MVSKYLFLKNLLSSWGLTFANIVVSLFLTPFVVHSLGNIRYGIWSLILSLVGYMGISDVGLRRSINKYINQYLAQKDNERALQVVSTSVGILMVIFFIVMVVSIVLGSLFYSIFSAVPSSFESEVRITIFIAALEFGSGLIGSVFRRAVESFDRFDIINYSRIFMLILRTALVIWVLTFFPSLTNLALASFAVQAIMSFFFIVAAYRVWPNFRVSLALIKKNTALELAKFGGPTFFDNISAQIINYTDLTVIGILMSVSDVTFYSIGFSMILYARTFLEKITTILTPTLFRETAIEDFANLRFFLMRGINLGVVFSLPLAIGFIIFGDTFIALWMGPDFFQSAAVLAIHATTLIFLPMVNMSKIIILGFGKPVKVAGISLVEAIANLLLSIFFVTRIGLGLQGVALGTVVPFFVSGTVLVFIMARMIHLPFYFLNKMLFQWLLAGTVYGLVCVCGKKLFNIHNWWDFVALITTLVLVYIPIGFFYILDKGSRRSLVEMLPVKKTA